MSLGAQDDAAFRPNRPIVDIQKRKRMNDFCHDSQKSKPVR